MTEPCISVPGMTEPGFGACLIRILNIPTDIDNVHDNEVIDAYNKVLLHPLTKKR